MKSIRSPSLEGIVRRAGNAVLVFPAGGIEFNAFARFLLLVKGVPQRVFLVRPHAEFVPHLPIIRRIELTALGDGVQMVDFRYGFDDDPDIPQALSQVGRLELVPSETRYYVVDDRAAAGTVTGMSRWRKWLFVAMSAACVSAAEYFHLPPDTTTEIEVHPRRMGT